MRRGAVYRSGELNGLTASDVETLASLGIRRIFDFRTNGERAAAPTRWTRNPPAILPVPVGFGADEDPGATLKVFFAEGPGPASAVAAMQAATAKIALDGAAGIGQVLRAIGAGESPALLHCTAGKDRTGVVAAMLLLLLGVPEERVYEDYLRSNDAVSAQIARFRAAGAASGMPPALAAMPPETIRVLLGVERSFLDAAFAAIRARYGSIDAYVAEGLRLTERDIDSLRAALLD